MQYCEGTRHVRHSHIGECNQSKKDRGYSIEEALWLYLTEYDKMKVQYPIALVEVQQVEPVALIKVA
eukprot:12262464-Karenia_brevis.AAC.1